MANKIPKTLKLTAEIAVDFDNWNEKIAQGDSEKNILKDIAKTISYSFNFGKISRVVHDIDYVEVHRE